MSDTVIKVENLFKQYWIGAREDYKTFRETLVDAAKVSFQRFTNRKLSGSMPDSPSFMPSSLYGELRGKRVYRFAEQNRGAGHRILN